MREFWQRRVRGITRVLDSTRSEKGSAPVEFVLVGAILSVIALAIVQLGISLHIRNTVTDAAAEGARYASLQGNSALDGELRTQELIATALGDGFEVTVLARSSKQFDYPTVALTVKYPQPLLGIWGFSESAEITSYAPIEQLTNSKGEN